MSNKMITYLPIFMRKSQVLNEIFNAEEQQIQYIEKDLEDIKLQLNIDTATWGLVIYEKELGIKTDLNKSYESRREVIKGKWRGVGKVDATLIKIVSDAWTNGQVIVNFNGHIVITFTSKIGTPDNIEDLMDAIEEIKPAHLVIDYKYRYLLINEIHNVMTIDTLNNTLIEKFAGGDEIVN